jgi:hypothetical protein
LLLLLILVQKCHQPQNDNDSNELLGCRQRFQFCVDVVGELHIEPQKTVFLAIAILSDLGESSFISTAFCIVRLLHNLEICVFTQCVIGITAATTTHNIKRTKKQQYCKFYIPSANHDGSIIDNGSDHDNDDIWNDPTVAVLREQGITATRTAAAGSTSSSKITAAVKMLWKSSMKKTKTNNEVTPHHVLPLVLLKDYNAQESKQFCQKNDNHNKHNDSSRSNYQQQQQYYFKGWHS